jgi:hypothetical protein
MYDKLPSLQLFPHDRSDNIIIATIYHHRSFLSLVLEYEGLQYYPEIRCADNTLNRPHSPSLGCNPTKVYECRLATSVALLTRRV